MFRSGALLAAAVVLAFWKVLFHPEYTLLVGGDMCAQAFPWLNAAAYWLKRGTLLLWDPYVYAGKANLGELQPGVLYPLYWPFMIPWTTGGGMNLTAMEALVLFHFFLVACFTFYAARVFGLTRTGALVAAVGFALAGFTTQVYGFLNIFCGFVWMPLVLAFYRRSLDPGRRPAPWLAAAAAALTLSFLAGHHVPPIQTALLAAFYGVFVAVRRGRGAGRVARLAPLAALASVGIAAGALAAVQWLPSLEWGRLAYRWVSEGAPIRWLDTIPYPILEKTGSVSPQDAMSLLFPYMSVDYNLYVGAPFLLLAVAGALLARAAEARLFAMLGAVYFLSSWGALSALHGWLNTFIPGLWFARELFHYLIPMQLCLAFVAGWGIDALTVPDAAADDRAAALFVARAAVAAGVTIAACGALIVALHTIRALPFDSAYIRAAASLATYAALLGALLYFLHAGRISRPRFAVLVVSLVFVDLASHVSAGVRTRGGGAVHSFWRIPPEAAFLREERRREIFRVDDGAAVFPPNFGDAWRLDATMGHGATALVRYLDFRGVGWGPGSNATALLNAGYFTSPVPIAGMKQVFSGAAPIYRNPRAVPRAFAATAYRPFGSGESMLSWLGSPFFDPRETVLLREADVGKIPPEVLGALRREETGITVGVARSVAAADREAAGKSEDPRLRVFRPPWGWSDGDELSIALRPDAALAHLYARARFFPSSAGRGLLTLRLQGESGSAAFPIEFPALGAGQAEPEAPAEAWVDLGPLAPVHYWIDAKTEGETRIHALRFTTAPPRQNERGAGAVAVASYTPNRIVLEASLERPALVVASEVFYPGWEAAVDGRPAPLLEADYILRAVPVGQGRHTVEMRFRPASFRLGLAVSVLAAAAIALGLLAPRALRGKARA